MAVPKKRTGKSAQAKRRANWKATVPATTTCKGCGSIVLTHTVCPDCGYYKQGIVSIKHENYVGAEKKTSAKKVSAKKEAAAQTKAEKSAIDAIEVKEEKTAKNAVKKADTKSKTSAEEKVEEKVREKTAEKMVKQAEKAPKKKAEKETEKND